MRRLINFVIVALLAGAMPEVSFAQTELTVSSEQQSVEDYAREWRRARKMSRACGAIDDYMQFVAFSEGALVSMKADQQRKLGKPVKEDAKDYILGFSDDFDVSAKACDQHAKAFAPVIVAIDKAFRERSGLVLYLPPSVPCPANRSC